MPCDAKFIDECLCLHNNNTVLIKQISLFETRVFEILKELKRGACINYVGWGAIYTMQQKN